MSEIAISVEGLSKRYALGELRPSAWLRERLGGGQRERAAGGGPGFIWALDDVSFEVRRGEILGIIGSNGAGKSTLLKILSRITVPTRGRARLFGRVGSLLEVGTGFHPELTGRENIFLNGAIIGMHRSEISARFEEIVEFADIATFLDTPVKRYSSGMYMRLGFAIAAHLDPEILIVDEVLAVGDARFRRKCLNKMDEVSREGRTVLFVSHRMEAIQRLCKASLLLEEGRVRHMGDTAAAVELYLGTTELSACLPDRGPADVPVRIRTARLIDAGGVPCTSFVRGAAAMVEVAYEVNRAVSGAHIFARIQSSEDVTLFSTGDCDMNRSLHRTREAGTYEARFPLPTVLLNEGEYSIYVSSGVPFVELYDGVPNALRFRVQAPPDGEAVAYLRSRPGLVVQDITWDTKRADALAPEAQS